MKKTFAVLCYIGWELYAQQKGFTPYETANALNAYAAESQYIANQQKGDMTQAEALQAYRNSMFGQTGANLKECRRLAKLYGQFQAHSYTRISVNVKARDKYDALRKVSEMGYQLVGAGTSLSRKVSRLKRTDRQSQRSFMKRAESHLDDDSIGDLSKIAKTAKHTRVGSGTYYGRSSAFNKGKAGVWFD
jgi:hypothetical protein